MGSFSDVVVIEERIERGLMNKGEAAEALRDLEGLYRAGKVNYGEFQYLKMKLTDIING